MKMKNISQYKAKAGAEHTGVYENYFEWQRALFSSMGMLSVLIQTTRWLRPQSCFCWFNMLQWKLCCSLGCTWTHLLLSNLRIPLWHTCASPKPAFVFVVCDGGESCWKSWPVLGRPLGCADVLPVVDIWIWALSHTNSSVLIIALFAVKGHIQEATEDLIVDMKPYWSIDHAENPRVDEIIASEPFITIPPPVIGKVTTLLVSLMLINFSQRTDFINCQRMGYNQSFIHFLGIHHPALIYVNKKQ